MTGRSTSRRTLVLEVAVVELHDRVSRQACCDNRLVVREPLMTPKIVVYSKSACPQCDTAKTLLKSRGFAFEEIRLDDEVQRQAFYERCGPSVRQMPQVFINDQRVGGVAGLQAALAQIGSAAG